MRARCKELEKLSKQIVDSKKMVVCELHLAVEHRELWPLLAVENPHAMAQLEAPEQGHQLEGGGI